jgi:hypothetical protein
MPVMSQEEFDCRLAMLALSLNQLSMAFRKAFPDGWI